MQEVRGEILCEEDRKHLSSFSWLHRHSGYCALVWPQYASWSENTPSNDQLVFAKFGKEFMQVSTPSRAIICSGADLEGPSAGFEKEGTLSIQLNIGWLRSRL